MPEDTVYYKHVKRVANDCNVLDNYSIALYPEHTPIKTLRIAINVFQKSDGSGSFNGSDTYINTNFKELIDSVNTRLSNLKIHSPYVTNSHIPDSKIQIEYKVVFHKNDVLYSYTSFQQVRIQI